MNEATCARCGRLASRADISAATPCAKCGGLTFMVNTKRKNVGTLATAFREARLQIEHRRQERQVRNADGLTVADQRLLKGFRIKW